MIAEVILFEESDCNQERELTRKGQEPFTPKRNFGLQTKNVNYESLEAGIWKEIFYYQRREALELPREGAQLQENGKLL